jgi:hypothetical protein
MTPRFVGCASKSAFRIEMTSGYGRCKSCEIIGYAKPAFLDLMTKPLGQNRIHPISGTPTGKTESNSFETIGAARFTVITPQLIRMEYSPNGQFIDSPSWFARNRSARYTDYRAHRTGETLIIDTGAIRLAYVNDGRKFSANNLQAKIKIPALLPCGNQE